jgi:hypothetical protein
MGKGVGFAYRLAFRCPLPAPRANQYLVSSLFAVLIVVL